jgi:hypothetical protein
MNVRRIPIPTPPARFADFRGSARRGLAWLSAWTALWMLMSPAAAQDGVTFQQQAERLQNINAYLLDFRADASPRPDAGLWAQLDLTPQPSVDNTVGRKEEPLDPPSVAPRVRILYALSSGWFAGAAYSPGVEFEGYEAEYLSVEAGYRARIGDWFFGARASFTDGDVTGPITESGVEDDFAFETFSGDLALGRDWGAFTPYVFAGATSNETALEIESDGALLRGDDATHYGGLGLTWRFRTWRFGVQQQITDDYLRHIVASAAYRF